MKVELSKTKEIYKSKRRMPMFRFRKDHQIKKPDWMKERNDFRFEEVYSKQKMLLRKGRIAIAKIVQANTLLFYPGKYNSPASVVFSEDPYFEEYPEQLAEIGHQLFRMKGTQTTDEELQKFSDILADELVAPFNMLVPNKMTYGKDVYFTTIMVHREHLPYGCIEFDFFPLLVCPEKTDATMILPSMYWASEVGKSKKLLSNNTLTRLLENNPEKFISVIEEHINIIEKVKLPHDKDNAWSRILPVYEAKQALALIYCGRFQEAYNFLEDICQRMSPKSEESGSTFYIMVMDYLAVALIEMEMYDAAREKISSIEKAISKSKDAANMKAIHTHFNTRRMELDLYNGDLEAAGNYLKSVLDKKHSNTYKGHIYICLGIYYYLKTDYQQAKAMLSEGVKKVKHPYMINKASHYLYLIDKAATT